MYNHNKAQQIKNRVHISWDILYMFTMTFNDKSVMKELIRQSFYDKMASHVIRSNFVGFRHNCETMGLCFPTSPLI